MKLRKNRQFKKWIDCFPRTNLIDIIVASWHGAIICQYFLAKELVVEKEWAVKQ